jgi:excisionase family DNA binding protein
VSERLLTPAYVADRCQISAKTVLRAIHRGDLRASRLGASGAYRMRGADVDIWIEASVVTPARPAAAATPGPRRPTALGGEETGRLRLTPGMGRQGDGARPAPHSADGPATNRATG